jgi:hypothetical protein
MYYLAKSTMYEAQHHGVFCCHFPLLGIVTIFLEFLSRTGVFYFLTAVILNKMTKHRQIIKYNYLVIF